MNKSFSKGKNPSEKTLKGPSQRQLRVAEEIRHVLADVFAKTEFHDADLHGKTLTITEVRMSPDLRNAITYVAHLGKDDVSALLPALKRVSPFLRGQLAQRLSLKFLPDLRFHPDTGLDYATKIDALLRSPEVIRDLKKED